MEKTLLTTKNCHRAAKVMMVGHPEEGEYEFEWCAIRTNMSLFHSEFKHRARARQTVCVEINDTDDSLNQWKVTSWKYEANFEDLWDDAVRAFSGTSHVPEDRARQYIVDFENTLQADLEDLPSEEHERYIKQFRSWLIELFNKRSRIVSSVVAGPARFPVARMERANNAFDKALQAFEDWRKKFARAAARKIEAAKTPEEKADAEWAELKHQITSNTAVCVSIDKGESGCWNRSAFTNSIFGKVERLANNGKTGLVLKALEYIKYLQNGDFGLKKPLFTSRHKIWKLESVCTEAIEKRSERENKADAEIYFADARIVKNFADDRLQIFHEEKPAAEVIEALKANSFRWSRTNGCWQRQLTQNAVYAVARVFFGNDVNNPERQALIHELSNL